MTLRERSSSVTLCSAVERNYHYCVERNRELIPPATDMFRVMDGAEDGIPVVFVDQMADRILVSTLGCSITADLDSGMNNLFYSVWGYRPVTEPDRPLNSLMDNIMDLSLIHI